MTVRTHFHRNHSRVCGYKRGRKSPRLGSNRKDRAEIRKEARRLDARWERLNKEIHKRWEALRERCRHRFKRSDSDFGPELTCPDCKLTVALAASKNDRRCWHPNGDFIRDTEVFYCPDCDHRQTVPNRGF